MLLASLAVSISFTTGWNHRIDVALDRLRPLLATRAETRTQLERAGNVVIRFGPASDADVTVTPGEFFWSENGSYQEGDTASVTTTVINRTSGSQPSEQPVRATLERDGSGASGSDWHVVALTIGTTSYQPLPPS